MCLERMIAVSLHRLHNAARRYIYDYLHLHIRICVYKINIRSKHVRMTCPLTVIIVFPKRLMYCFRRDMYIIELDHGDMTCAVTNDGSSHARGKHTTSNRGPLLSTSTLTYAMVTWQR